MITREEAEKLAVAWERFCKEEYERWRQEHKLPFPLAWNPNWMSDHVDERSAQWKDHMKKVGEEWWRPYGIRLIWPGNDYEPLRLEIIGEETPQPEGGRHGQAETD